MTGMDDALRARRLRKRLLELDALSGKRPDSAANAEQMVAEYERREEAATRRAIAELHAELDKA